MLTRYGHESAHGDDQDLVAASLLEAFVTCGKVALPPDGSHGPRSAVKDISQDETHGDRNVEREKSNDGRQHARHLSRRRRANSVPA